MIYLVQGTDTVSSRTFLSKLKSRYSSTKNLDGKNINPSLLNQETLLADKELLVIENFSLPKDNPFKEIPLDLVIWLDKETVVPKWVDKVFSFKEREQVNNFKLADAIGYGQEKVALQTLGKLLQKNTPPELIIGSIVRQLRLILLIFEDKKEKISTSSFVTQKITDQARNWNRRKLRSALLLTLKTDLEIKSGKLTAENALAILINHLCRLVNK